MTSRRRHTEDNDDDKTTDAPTPKKDAKRRKHTDEPKSGGSSVSSSSSSSSHSTSNSSAVSSHAFPVESLPKVGISDVSVSENSSSASLSSSSVASVPSSDVVMEIVHTENIKEAALPTKHKQNSDDKVVLQKGVFTPEHKTVLPSIVSTITPEHKTVSSAVSIITPEHKTPPNVSPGTSNAMTGMSVPVMFRFLESVKKANSLGQECLYEMMTSGERLTANDFTAIFQECSTLTTKVTLMGDQSGNFTTYQATEMLKTVETMLKDIKMAGVRARLIALQETLKLQLQPQPQPSMGTQFAKPARRPPTITTNTNFAALRVNRRLNPITSE